MEWRPQYEIHILKNDNYPPPSTSEENPNNPISSPINVHIEAPLMRWDSIQNDFIPIYLINIMYIVLITSMDTFCLFFTASVISEFMTILEQMLKAMQKRLDQAIQRLGLMHHIQQYK